MLNVLSLFDWISCWQVALSRFWVPYKYFASEIEEKSIYITKKNFPNTIHIGDVQACSYWYDNIYSKNKKKYLFWEPDKSLKDTMWQINNFDLLIWWSPCQWFSYAGKMLNFEDKRSKLFFEYARILTEIKPKYFILENVRMKKEWSDIITEKLFWVENIFIDSQNIWAQQRKRYYWVWELQPNGTYKKLDIPIPTGPGKSIEEYLEENVDEKYFLNDIQVEKAIENCKWKIFKSWKTNWSSPLVRINKSLCLTARNFWKDNRQVNRIIQYPRWNNPWWLKWENWKIPCITTSCWKYNNHLLNGWRIRVFTEKEMERLQWLPDNYTLWVPNYKRQEMIWNWFHVDTLEYILSFIIKRLENKSCKQ